MKSCDFCKKPLSKENTPNGNGLNGYSVRREIKEAPGRTREKIACRECYLKYYKETYPKADLPELS